MKWPPINADKRRLRAKNLSASIRVDGRLVRAVLVVAVCVCLMSCRATHADGAPNIVFTRIPSASSGSPERLEPVEGRVKGAAPGQKIVLFALSGVWWVQPAVEHPFTEIQNDYTWKSAIHPGIKYAALLVDPNYRPPLTASSLPERGGAVRAVTIVPGSAPGSTVKSISFSGYQWEARQNASDPDGSPYDPGNAFTDNRGFLHLRVRKQEEHWVSAEVKLSRSLGYGSYRFVVRDISQLEPAAVFAIFTWDDLGPAREMDIEISRWGEPEEKNAQFVIQPYVVPANTIRFDGPAGPLTYLMNWLPGLAAFQTMLGRGGDKAANVVAEHVFTSGIPNAGNERIHLNLWVYANKRHPLQHEFEVVVEKFEFLP
jgi:hypothetical protein